MEPFDATVHGTVPGDPRVSDLRDDYPRDDYPKTIDPRAEIFARLTALEADVAALKRGPSAACTAVTITPEQLAAQDAAK